MKKILISLLSLILVIGLVGLGAFAYFSDTETSSGNVFTAGTLDLRVDGQDDPYVAKFTLSNLKPGDATAGGGYWITPGKTLVWKAKNVGSLPGKLTIYMTNVVNYENNQNEPEALVDPTTGNLEGELGNYVRPQCFYNGAWCNEIGSITGIGSGKWNIVTDKPLAPGAEAEIIINWWINDPAPAKNSNIIQSDSVEFDIVFQLDQS